MSALVCFTMDNLGDAADLGRGVIQSPREPGKRPALEQGFPALLDLYGRHGVTITHFVEGWNGEAHPQQIRQLLDQGHSLGMHGWQHENWSQLGDQRAAELARRATDTLEKACGIRPRAFRAPGGRTTPFTRQILRELGYRIDASQPPGEADGGPIERLADDLWAVPYEWSGVDATHWLWHQSSCEEVEQLWKSALLAAAREDRHIIFIWHPHVMGIDPRKLEVGENILRFVHNDDRFRLATLNDLVEKECVY